MAEAFDVIVVGAGVGGLYAGASLARHGQRVLVLERHDQIGGYEGAIRAGHEVAQVLARARPAARHRGQ